MILVTFLESAALDLVRTKLKVGGHCRDVRRGDLSPVLPLEQSMGSSFINQCSLPLRYTRLCP